MTGRTRIASSLVSRCQYGGRKVAVDTRGVIKRFFVAERPEFSRHRHSIWLRTTGRLGLYKATSGSSMRMHT
jgi:hypothetical protein